MNNKILAGIITGGAIITTAASAYAFSSPNIDSIKTALNNNDYTAWQTAIADSPNADDLLSKINESNFSQLVEAEKLMESGDRDSAQTIFDELGINGMFGRRGMGQNQAIKDAITNNDYTAWQTAIADSPNADDLLSKINESNFSQLVEAEKLMESGDREGAQTIFDELDIKGMFGGRGGHGEGMNGNPEQNQAVRDALTNNDYAAWKTAITATPRGEEMLSVINESNFSRLVEAHNLMEQGRAIMDELGLPDRGKGMNKGNQNNNSNNS